MEYLLEAKTEGDFLKTPLFILVAVMGIGFLQAQTTVTVDEDNADWGFLDETVPGPGTVTAEFVMGPATPPGGTGSAHLVLGANTDGVLLGTQNHAGLPLADILTLSYATYQNMTPQAIALQFNVDYDNTDGSVAWQGRLVFEPLTIGPVQTGTWQTWDALAGRWWSSGTPIVGDVPAAATCTQGSPCTWAQVLMNYPNIANHSGALAGILVKAGSGWPAGWDGNVDRLHIETAGFNTIYDFETNVPVELQSFGIE